MGKLLVIGSLNMDMTIFLEEAPKRGETVYGHDFLLTPGGKGANQAVAAARLGAQVAMLGRVGDDLFGKSQIEGLQRDGIDTRPILTTPGVSTGVACIQVVKGDNSIVLDPGANDKLTPRDIEDHRAVMAECDAVMLQFEIPMNTIEHTIAMARELGKKIILTPAPVVPFEESLLEGLYLLLPNEHEAQRITGIHTGTLEGAQQALTALADKGVAHPLITLGSKGILYWDGEQPVYQASRKVKAVDTTGAGDTFAGALVASLLDGADMEAAVQFAQSAAAVSVTRKGAQCSIPTREEVAHFFEARD